MIPVRTPAWILLILMALSGSAAGEPVDAPEPDASETCPVCGMFVARYAEWIAVVRYSDGHAHFFDGAKDMFKYLLDMPKWAPGHDPDQIDLIAVTDYYDVVRIDARQAWYVVGSDVLGPMGHELVPLQSEDEAKDFLSDHGGKRILRFGDVDLEMLENLDAGRFR